MVSDAAKVGQSRNWEMQVFVGPFNVLIVTVYAEQRRSIEAMSMVEHTMICP